MNVSIAQINRLGNREVNEDRIVIVEDDDCMLMVVADGMGGHLGGDVAAQILVDTLDKHFRRSKKPIDNPQAFLRLAIETAHTKIVTEAQQHAPKIDPRTTCVACLVQGNSAFWAHVGDSRLYLLRGNRILARTIDHSYVEDLFRQGLISESDMLTHPKRSYLTQCIGGPEHLPDISYGNMDSMDVGDLILLCSDGLWTAISDLELRGLAPHPQLESGLNELAARAEGNSYPLSDNISAVALRIMEHTESCKKPAAVAEKPRIATSPADNIDHAISAIHEALEDYRDEMDYDPDTK